MIQKLHLDRVGNQTIIKFKLIKNLEKSCSQARFLKSYLQTAGPRLRTEDHTMSDLDPHRFGQEYGPVIDPTISENGEK